MSYVFSDKPKSKKKADNNYPGEPTASKPVTPVGKGYGTYFYPFDFNKEGPSDKKNKCQGLFVN